MFNAKLIKLAITNKFYFMKITINIEDYLKALFQLKMKSDDNKVGTNQLADFLNISPASVSRMLRKLREMKLVDFKKYGKIELTKKGEDIAVKIVRKHRLWETFLFEQMNFTWDEVHEVAHQLEHIKSVKLIDELDRLLNYPKVDPHGDLIPDKDGNFIKQSNTPLSQLNEGATCKIVAVNHNSSQFLKYVTQIGLTLGSEIKILEKRKFDGSMLVYFNNKKENVSQKFAENIITELV